MTLVDKVVCKKNGVEVLFVPDLFDEETGENATISNCYMTCIGIKVSRGKVTFSFDETGH